jgi:hypothetical protein
MDGSDRFQVLALADRLTEAQARTVRKLLGLVFIFGDKTAVVAEHFSDSLFLFAFGRLLVAFADWLGMRADQASFVHLLSMWYEMAIFLGFCVASFLEVMLINWHEFRVEYNRRRSSHG